MSTNTANRYDCTKVVLMHPYTDFCVLWITASSLFTRPKSHNRKFYLCNSWWILLYQYYKIIQNILEQRGSSFWRTLQLTDNGTYGQKFNIKFKFKFIINIFGPIVQKHLKSSAERDQICTTSNCTCRFYDQFSSFRRCSFESFLWV